MRHGLAEYAIGILFLLAVPAGYRAMLYLAARVRLIPWEGGGMPPLRYFLVGVMAGLFSGAHAREMLGQSGWDYWILAGALVSACFGAAFALAEIVSMAASGLYTYGADDAPPDRWLVAEAPGAPQLFAIDEPVQIGVHRTARLESRVAVLALLVMFLMEIATTLGFILFALVTFDGFGFSSAGETILSAGAIFLATFAVYMSIAVGLPMTRYNLWLHSPGGMVSLMSMMGRPVKLVEVTKQEVVEPSANLNGGENGVGRQGDEQ